MMKNELPDRDNSTSSSLYLMPVAPKPEPGKKGPHVIPGTILLMVAAASAAVLFDHKVVQSGEKESAEKVTYNRAIYDLQACVEAKTNENIENLPVGGAYREAFQKCQTELWLHENQEQHKE